MKTAHLTLAVTAFAAATAAQHEVRDSVRVDTPVYSAEFASGHAEMIGKAPKLDGIEPILRLRYLGARRGSTAQQRWPDPALTEQQGVIRYHHGPVVETYRTSGHGFEQSFHLAKALQGGGDLVIAIGADGNLHCEPRPARHQSLMFGRDGAPLISYGEAFAFDRRGHRVDVLTSYDGAGRIELTVPKSFLDTASYPVVVDPAVGPVMNLTPGSLGGNPDIAYDHEQDRYIIAYRTVGLGNYFIQASLLDGDGNLIADHSVAALPFGNNIDEPAVAFSHSINGNSFLVVWREINRIRGRLMRVSNGTPHAPPFDISSPAVGEFDRRPTVAGPGEIGMIVAWDRTFVGESVPRAIRSCELHWPNPATPGNVVISALRMIQTVTSGYVQNAHLAKSSHARFSSGFYWAHNRLVWERFWTGPPPGDFDLETCAFRVRPNAGQFSLTQTVALVPGADQIGIDEYRHDIGSLASTYFNPTTQQYLIAWQDERDIMAHKYDNNGPVGAPITVRATALDETDPVVGVGSCEFTIAYGESVTVAIGLLDVRAARVLLDGTVATDHTVVEVPGNMLRNRLVTSVRSAPTGTVNASNRTLIVWENQSTTGGIVGKFFEPVSATMSPFGVACPGPLGELPAIGTIGGEPTAGSTTFEFTITNAPTISIAALVVSDQLTTTPIPGAPGCFLYAGLPLLTVLPTATNSVGYGSVPVPIPCAIPSGVSLAFQWAVYSPAANALGWIVSNDMDITWQH